MRTRLCVIIGSLCITIGACLFLNSCSIWEPVCRHDAVYAAIVVGEDYPVRFVYGDYGRKKHVRAQAKINGEWVWIEPFMSIVRIGKNDFRFRPTMVYSYEEYMKRVDRRIKSSDINSTFDP